MLSRVQKKLCTVTLIWLALAVWSPNFDFASASETSLYIDSRVSIERVSRETDGYTFRITYQVPVPMEVYWRIKTDFESDFVAGNPFIHAHRFIGRSGNIAVTQTEFKTAPGKTFTWVTTVQHRQHRLLFELGNAEEIGHNFNGGSIQLEDAGPKTNVIQIIRFKFPGDFFWVNFPWHNGMRSSMVDIARWEQKAVYRLRNSYRSGFPVNNSYRGDLR